MPSDISTQPCRIAKCALTRHGPPTSPHSNSFPSDTAATSSDGALLQLRVADLEAQVQGLELVVGRRQQRLADLETQVHYLARDSARVAEVEAQV